MPKIADNHTFVIAEAGVNHNGDLSRARAMVKAARAAGADAVKFQSFRAESIAARTAAKAAYQERNTGEAGSQLAMLKALELSEHDQLQLRDLCRLEGIEFMSTPFDLESAHFLIEQAGVARLKIASGEVTNAPLLLALARSGKPAILSTGMCTIDDIRAALGVLAFGYMGSDRAPSEAAFAAAFESERDSLRAKITLLQCTTEYPAPPETIHLRAMDQLRETFGLPVGLSDHSQGIAVALAAVARGALMIEKHFTLDRTLPGPDHAASLTVDELTAMVAGIRDIERALGGAEKQLSAAERANRIPARKSLVALAPIAVGEAFSPANLGAKRPGGGVSPLAYWTYLGKAAARSYTADEMIDPQ
jgi:N-acetylneuraminate synthase